MKNLEILLQSLECNITARVKRDHWVLGTDRGSIQSTLAIPDGPEVSRFHTNKLPLAILDGHTIPAYRTVC